MSHQPEHALHLSVDQLAAHLERRLHGTEREAVVAHLVECAECRDEYIQAGDVLAGTRSKWIWVRAGVGLVAAAVLVVAVLPRSSSDDEAGVTRDRPAQRVTAPDVPPLIRLAAPADGERLTSTEVSLAWHPDAGNALYRVTVQTADGGLVWKKETSDTTVILPPSVPLAAGATYYWIVDALHTDGRSARSPVNSFTR